MLELLDALNLQLNSAGPDVVAFVGGGGKSSSLFRLGQEIMHRGQRVLLTVTTHLGASQVQRAPAFVIAEGDQLPLAAMERALDMHRGCLLIGGLTESRAQGVAPALVDRLVSQAQTLGVAAILVEADGSRRLPFKAPAAHEPALPASTTLLVPVMGMDAVGAPLDEAHVHRVELVRRILALDPTDATLRLTPAQAADLLVHPQGGAKLLPPGARCMPLLNKAETTQHRTSARLIAHLLAATGHSSLIGAVGQAADLDQTEPIFERWAPIAAVVLAAGQSSRMGRAKQVEVVDGEPMVVRAVRTVLQSDAARVLVVTGAYVDAVTAVLAPLKEQVGDRLQLVYNPDWQTGQASSIRAAAQALGSLPQTGAALFMPTDQPFVPAMLLQQLLRAWRTGARLVAPLVEGQLRGAPALFDRSLWPELFTLAGDVGARPLLQKYRAEVLTLPVPGHLLRDIDTPQDLK